MLKFVDDAVDTARHARWCGGAIPELLFAGGAGAALARSCRASLATMRRARRIPAGPSRGSARCAQATKRLIEAWAMRCCNDRRTLSS